MTTEQNDNQDKWVDPAVLVAFKAAIPASQATGDYDNIWPYPLWHPTRGWVEFHSLESIERATLGQHGSKPAD